MAEECFKGAFGSRFHKHTHTFRHASQFAVTYSC